MNTAEQTTPAAWGTGLSDQVLESAIAIVGMSGRFPGAATPEQLWDNTVRGISGLRPVSEAELATARVDPALLADPRYVRVAGPVDGVEMFDPEFFGFSAVEAQITDPQHRIFLECCWEALENAGYRPDAVPGKTGVFAGCRFPYYLVRNLLPQPKLPAVAGPEQVELANERDSLTNLVSYKLGFTGPSLVVTGYCAASLVAVHLGCQSLLTFDCDTVLAGAAALELPQPAGYLFREGGMAAPNGSVRSLDAAAQGTVVGNGAGVVVLRRLSDALADGDHVQAVLLGSAANNGGRARPGFTAPGVEGQAEVIRYAQSVAGVTPAGIDYIECNATGNLLADTVELAALARVFAGRPAGSCVLGSVKPQIGYLDRAAGVAGLIRTVHALRHRMLPATLGFRSPNPALGAAGAPFAVLTEAREWPRRDRPRRAGVSSFGQGGNNAHVVLQEAPPAPARPARPAGPQLLVLSARSQPALRAAARRLSQHLAASQDDELADIAFTLQHGRTPFAHRLAVVCADHAAAAAALAAAATGEAAPTPGAARADAAFLETVGELWQLGGSVDWTRLHDGHRRRVPLPTYPFERQRCWLDPPAAAAPAAEADQTTVRGFAAALARVGVREPGARGRAAPGNVQHAAASAEQEGEDQ